MQRHLQLPRHLEWRVEIEPQQPEHRASDHTSWDHWWVTRNLRQTVQIKVIHHLNTAFKCWSIAVLLEFGFTNWRKLTICICRAGNGRHSRKETCETVFKYMTGTWRCSCYKNTGQAMDSRGKRHYFPSTLRCRFHKSQLAMHHLSKRLYFAIYSFTGSIPLASWWRPLNVPCNRALC